MSKALKTLKTLKTLKALTLIADAHAVRQPGTTFTARDAAEEKALIDGNFAQEVAVEAAAPAAKGNKGNKGKKVGEDTEAPAGETADLVE